MIIDYSTFRPTIAQLHSAGVTAVGRYIGWDSVPGYSSIGKNLTETEAQSLLKAGIDIFLAFEYEAQEAAKGTAQGKLDGELATAQLKELGAPPTMGVYFALDWDVPDYAPKLEATAANAKAKLGPVAEYFEAIHATKPQFTVGAYGGYWPVSRLFQAGLISLGWQTIAWSGGQWYPKAVIHQQASQVFGAADVDLHVTDSSDYGQWPRPKAAPVQTIQGHGKWTSNGLLTFREFAHEHSQSVLDVVVRTAVARAGTLGGAEQSYFSDLVNGNVGPDAEIPKDVVLFY